MLVTLLAQTADDFSTLPSAADAAATTAAAGGLAAVAIGMTIFWLIFGLGGTILFIVALIDVIRRDFPNQNDKILWIVLILLLAWLGPILYFLVGKKKGTLPA